MLFCQLFLVLFFSYYCPIINMLHLPCLFCVIYRALSSRLVSLLSSHTHSSIRRETCQVLKFIVFLFCSRLFICHFFDAFISSTARCFCVCFLYFFPILFFVFPFFFCWWRFYWNFIYCATHRAINSKRTHSGRKFLACFLTLLTLSLSSFVAGQFVSICLSLFLHTHTCIKCLYICGLCCVKSIVKTRKKPLLFLLFFIEFYKKIFLLWSHFRSVLLLLLPWLVFIVMLCALPLPHTIRALLMDQRARRLSCKRKEAESRRRRSKR